MTLSQPVPGEQGLQIWLSVRRQGSTPDKLLLTGRYQHGAEKETSLLPCKSFYCVSGSSFHSGMKSWVFRALPGTMGKKMEDKAGGWNTPQWVFFHSMGPFFGYYWFENSVWDGRTQTVLWPYSGLLTDQEHFFLGGLDAHGVFVFQKIDIKTRRGCRRKFFLILS